MAIYHLEAKAISRGVGRSAVAASAYMSCSRIYNDYDGIQHDYTRKQGLVYEQVLLPPQAPPEWADRSVLWNAVEEAEKTKDSRLAREFVAALPVELGKDEWIALLTEYVQNNFVNDGMCADFCIHDTDGHNPHAHIMLTVRPLAENGKWQNKTEKEYLCIKDGEERGFTSTEFKIAQTDGWEKQYQYKVGKKKVYMPPSQAEQQGYERASKYPKSTRYGRQNPIAERWNSDEQLLIWRKSWAEINNRYLEKHNIQSRIDHRSHKERGLDEQPTVHEGVTARMLEKKGYKSERCEINRQIKADNRLLRRLKEAVRKLSQAIIDTIPKLADTLETMRKNIAAMTYSILYSRNRQKRILRTIKSNNETIDKYTHTVKKLKAKNKEHAKALEEKKALPIYKIIQHKDLSRRITTLTEEREELRSEKNRLLNILNCEKSGDIEQVKKTVADMELSVEKLQKQEQKYGAELKTALAEFGEIQTQSGNFDESELIEYRLYLRTNKQKEYYSELQEKYGKNFDDGTAIESLARTDNMLGEDLYSQKKSILEKLRTLKRRQQRTESRPKRKSRDDGLEL